MRLRASFALMVCVPVLADAHGGGLNSEGCHTNRRTGDYHCHRSHHAPPSPSTAHLPLRTGVPRSTATSVDAPLPATPRHFMPAHRSPAGLANADADARSHAQPANRPFANCSAAKAAGAAPVYRGDPGYGPHLDRDDDGIGCEPYRGR